MAQQHTTAEAVLQESADRTNFLRSPAEYGGTSPSAKFGFDRIEHSVIVFNPEAVSGSWSTRPLKADVTLVLKANGMSVQEGISPEEARLLARALNMAADVADITNDLAAANAQQVPA